MKLTRNHQANPQKQPTDARQACLPQQAVTPTSSTHPTLQLQQQIGNRAVGSLLQAKLTIGQPNDPYEKEADRIAAQVVDRIHTPALQPQTLDEDEKTLQAKPQLQAKGNTLETPDGFEAQLAKHQSSGQPLPSATRDFMEPRFGADFSHVRIHQTPALADSIQARAFTHSNHIYFNQGQYSPGTHSGKLILAHELTHVIQQTSALHRQTQSKEEADSQGSISPDELEHSFDIKISSKYPFIFEATLEDTSWQEAYRILSRYYGLIEGTYVADKSRHDELIRLYTAHPVVSSISEILGSGSILRILNSSEMPPKEIWFEVYFWLALARKQLDDFRDIPATRLTTIEKLARSLEKSYNCLFEAHVKLRKITDNSIDGAERAINSLEVIASAGAVAATIATGGVATGAGVLAVASVSGITAAGYGVTQESARQVSETQFGLRKKLDLTKIFIDKGLNELATTFVGGILGGSLKNIFAKMSPRYISRISDEGIKNINRILIESGAEPVTRTSLMYVWEKRISAYIPSIATAPLEEVVKGVLIDIREKGEFTPEDILSRIGMNFWTDKVIVDSSIEILEFFGRKFGRK